MIKKTVLFFSLFFLFPIDALAISSIPSRLYTGQISDPTGLYYYNARYYDPELGIFTSADRAQGPNRYSYVSGNPIMRNDPTGNYAPVDAGGGGGSDQDLLYHFADPIMKYSPIPRFAAQALLGHYGGILTENQGHAVTTLDFLRAMGMAFTEETGVSFTSQQVMVAAQIYFGAAILLQGFAVQGLQSHTSLLHPIDSSVVRDRLSKAWTVEEAIDIAKQEIPGLKITRTRGLEKSTGFAGTYNPLSKGIKLDEELAGVDTVAHEVGHLLQDRGDYLGPWETVVRKYPQLSSQKVFLGKEWRVYNGLSMNSIAGEIDAEEFLYPNANFVDLKTAFSAYYYDYVGNEVAYQAGAGGAVGNVLRRNLFGSTIPFPIKIP